MPISASSSRPIATPVNPWLAVTALSLGVFGMVTIEELPIGVLTLMTDDFGTSEGHMGLTVTLPGFLAAATSLLVPVLIKSGDRRWVLIGALALMVAGSIGSAVATNFATLLAARLVVGISIGSFWSVAPTVAVRLVPERHVPRATALVFAGGSVAAVAGVPISTFIGDTLGWRQAFLVVASVGVLNAVVLWKLLPELPALGGAITVRSLAAVSRKPMIATGVSLTLLLVLAHFGGFTYARPLLETHAGVSASSIAPLLALTGVAGLVGNFAVSALVARSPMLAIGTVAATLAFAQVLFNVLASGFVSAAALMMLWGLAGGGIAASTQGWINTSKPEYFEAATGMNSAAFNAGIASGALAGGMIFDLIGSHQLLYVTAFVALFCLAVVVMYRMRFGTLRG